jgi:hypothetical protein
MDRKIGAVRPMRILELGVIVGSLLYFFVDAYFLFWVPSNTLPSALLGFVIAGTSCGLLYFAVRSEFWTDRIFVACAAIILLCCQILEYAIVYRNWGLVGSDNIIIRDATDCLYFSITTWTTVGYGDFVPSEKVRLWAASEALIGYFSMIIVISVIVTAMKDSRDK